MVRIWWKLAMFIIFQLIRKKSITRRTMKVVTRGRKSSHRLVRRGKER
jgi:hypothetical protein